MKKLEQIILLATCLAIMMMAAMMRDSRVWGHTPSDGAQATDSTQAQADVMRQTADGTLIVNTTAIGKDIVGYGGPVPVEIAIKDNRVVSVKALPNTETPDFFAQASRLIDSWNGKTVDEAVTMKVDAVSGATFSSRAIIDNVRAGLRHASNASHSPGLLDKMDHSAKTIAGLIVVLMAAIVPLFYRGKRYRTAQLVLNVVVLGLWGGTFLNWSMFVAYFSGGINVWISLVPIVMLVTAFIYPLFGKKNYYCTHICPFGSLQELAGRPMKRKWKLGSTTVKWLGRFRQALFATLMVLMLTGTGFEWMDYELFSAFIFQSAATVVIVLAIVFVVLSVFVTRPYCRFVCPTGTLFKLAEGNK